MEYIFKKFLRATVTTTCDNTMQASSKNADFKFI